MVDCWKAYEHLLARGTKPEAARYVLPGACETKIICTWNFREIRHIIELRASKQALPEMRALASEIRKIMKEYFTTCELFSRYLHPFPKQSPLSAGKI